MNRTVNIILIGLGFTAGVVGSYYLLKSINKTLVREKQVEADKKEKEKEEKKEEPEELLKTRIIKSKIEKEKSVVKMVKILVPSVIQEFKPRNRTELKNYTLRILVETVPTSKLSEVPRNIEELEALIKKAEIYEEYELYLEELYSKR